MMKTLTFFLALCLSPFHTAFAIDHFEADQWNPFGSIVVLSRSTRTVTLYNSAFNDNSSRVLRAYPTGSVPTSVAQFDQESVLVTVDGVPDRVDRINLRTGKTDSGFLFDYGLSGTMKGITRLSGGDILVSDSASGHHLERFALPFGSAPVRYTVGWPLNLMPGTQMLSPLPGNRFITCSGASSDALAIHNSSAEQLHLATALTPAPSLGSAHDVNGCVAVIRGQVGAVFKGSSSALRVYKPDLSATLWTYRDPALLSSPSALAVRFDGNWLVADSISNLILEINSSGERIGLFQPMLSADTTALIVIR